MAFDGITTKSILHELNSILINGKINKVFEPNKNEVILGIYSNGKNYALDICIDSLNCRINITTTSKPNPLNAPNFCMLLRKHIVGYKIKKIYNLDLERFIIIDLEGYDELSDLTNKKLIIELMGKHSNVILLNKSNFIIDSLRHLDTLSGSIRDILPAREYTYPTSNKHSFIDLKNFNEFYSIINTGINLKDLDKIISSNFIGFSRIFVKESLKILSINNNDFSKDSLNKFFVYIKELIDNINSNNVNCIRIINDKNKNDYIITIKNKLTNLDINFFIDDFYTKKYENELVTSYRNNILKLILSYLNKYKTRLSNIASRLKECENRFTYKLYGELITSNLYKIKNSNENSIQLENYYDNNNLIQIPLDKSISISNNAKKYFKKYNKLKTSLDLSLVQKQETEKELNYIESIIYELENCNTISEINDIYNEISENFIFKDSFSKNKSKKNSKKKNIQSSLLPIEYNIDGFTIYVGKNNNCNDYLTTKLAYNSDIWFHTKDIHGSHVILKNSDSINSSILEKCAQLAAYYSKGKLSSNVPVDYCLVKYVKKPSGSKPGMVIYTNNKTLFVNPCDYLDFKKF